jgi:Sigma-70, region 4
MNAREIIEQLLAGQRMARRLLEATVRLPPRGHRWIAIYTGVEPGRQVWRSTGLTDRDAAMAQARKWEVEARRQRAALGLKPRRANIRVRRRQAGTWAADELVVGPLSQAEVAMFLRISERAVRAIERRALAKMRADPRLRALWAELRARATAQEPELAEDLKTELTASEAAALLGLTHTAEERRVVEKMLAWLARHEP